MRRVMLAVMTTIKYATSMPADAVRTAQELAARDGMPVGQWIGRAIRAEAIRRGTRELHNALDADPALAREWADRARAGEDDAASVVHGQASA